MRYLYFTVSTLLFCLLLSCVKENVRSFDDKFYKKWNVLNTETRLIGTDTTRTIKWKDTDSTSITLEFMKSTELYQIIIDDSVFTTTAKIDTLNGPLDVLTEDIIHFSGGVWNIEYITNEGMKLSGKRKHSGSALFQDEVHEYYLRK
ncbi:MAG: hypothetical protein ACPGSD_06375 [Flavobacteriales bacterium]